MGKERVCSIIVQQVTKGHRKLVMLFSKLVTSFI